MLRAFSIIDCHNPDLIYAYNNIPKLIIFPVEISRQYQELIKDGNFSQILEIARLKNSIEDQYMQVFALYNLGKISDCLKLTEDVIQHLEPESNWVVKFLDVKAKVYRQLNKFEESIEIQEEALNLAMKNRFIELIPQLINNLGIIYQQNRHIDKAIAIYEQALTDYKDELQPKMEITLKGNLATIFSSQRNYTKALEQYHLILQDIIKYEIFEFYPNIYTFIGQAHSSIGNITLAIENFEKAIYYSKKQENFINILATLSGLVLVHNSSGNFDRALSYAKEAWSYSQKSKNQKHQATILENLAIVYYLTGEYDLSMKTGKKALEFANSSHSKLNASSILVWMIKFSAVKLEMDSMDFYLEELKGITEGSNDKAMLIMVKKGEAVRLFFNTDLESKAKSKQLFLEILQSEIQDFNLKTSSINYLIEFYLLELQFKEDEIIVKKILDLIKILNDHADLEKNYYVLTKSKIFKAKLYLVMNNYNQTRGIIEEINGILKKFTFPLLKLELQRFENAAKKFMDKGNDDWDQRFNNGGLFEYIKEWNNPEIDGFLGSILHPVRFKILKILESRKKIPNVEIRKLLMISQTSMSRHVERLKQDELIRVKMEFVNGRPQQLIELLPKAIMEMRRILK